MIKIAPSILSADFADLGNAVREITEAGADWIHFDVMDGHFVPNLTFGPGMCKAVRPYTSLPIDVHLMVTDPGRWIKPFADAGADIITLHIEAEPEPVELLSRIHSLGLKAGIVLNPETPAEAVDPYLQYCDLVLLMTVHPGFGGQGFIYEVVEKIRLISGWIAERNLPCELEVDGGVNPETAVLCREAGASVLVAGSSIFKAADRKQQISLIRG